MPGNQLLPAFHFTLQYSGLKGSAAADTAFESVSGIQLTAGMIADDKKDTAIFNPVVLKRAVSTQPSPLRQWVLKSLNGAKTKPLPEVMIHVLDETHQPVITIRLLQVTAAGWQLGPLHAQQSELLVEEFALRYQSLEWLPK